MDYVKLDPMPPTVKNLAPMTKEKVAGSELGGAALARSVKIEPMLPIAMDLAPMAKEKGMGSEVEEAALAHSVKIDPQLPTSRILAPVMKEKVKDSEVGEAVSAHSVKTGPVLPADLVTKEKVVSPERRAVSTKKHLDVADLVAIVKLVRMMNTSREVVPYHKIKLLVNKATTKNKLIFEIF